METRRVFLAAVLSMAVLVAWQLLFPAPRPETREPGEAGQRIEEVTPEPAAALGETTAPRTSEELGEELGAGESAAVPRIEATAEERVILESTKVRAEFTGRGAQLVSFVLKEHTDAAGEPVDLVRRRASGPYPFALVASGARAAETELNQALFEVERGGAGRAVTFRYAGPAGRAEKRFALTENDLLEVEVTVPGETGWGLWLGPGLRNPSPQEQDARFAGRSAVYSLDGEIEREDSLRLKEPLWIEGGGLRWIGLQDTYFLAAWMGGGAIARARLEPVLVEAGPGGATSSLRYLDAESKGDDGGDAFAREQVLTVFATGESLEGRAYFGPKEYRRLAQFGLERTVNLGIFWFIARPLLWGLRWIYDNVIGNYGWAIVLMTVLIRILLFPLTHKGFVSMQKMQRLNPKMQAIRQKYRPKLKDKQGRPNSEAQRKMNEEIMALYKSEGVNPAGGCLPMLLQIPVFFAFYNLLSSAFELRQAPWLGWVQDLSAMDPYYILPVAMGIAMLVQQKLMPATMDPTQRRLMMFMPFFITFICLKLPSGLALYWTTSNLLGILQQGFYSRLREDAPAVEAPAKAKRKART